MKGEEGRGEREGEGRGEAFTSGTGWRYKNKINRSYFKVTFQPKEIPFFPINAR